MRTVIGLLLVPRRTVLRSVPEGCIEIFFNAFHSRRDCGKIRRFAEGLRHQLLSLERQVKPSVEQDRHVLVIPPVAPEPAALARNNQTVVSDFPDRKVALDCRVNGSQGFDVSGV